MSKSKGLIIGIKFTEALVGNASNKEAFAIIGKEYKYVNGPLIPKMYKVTNIELHPSEPNSILLTIDWWSRFNNVEGDLSISYDAAIGNLTGAGGAVESFEVDFTPTDLIQTPNPGIIETLTGAPELNVLFLKVNYINGQAPSETISAAVGEVTVLFQPTETINP